MASGPQRLTECSSRLCEAKTGNLPYDYRSRDVSKRRCGTLPALSTDNLKRKSTFESILTVPHRCLNGTFLALLRLREAYVRLPSLCDLVPPRIAELSRSSAIASVPSTAPTSTPSSQRARRPLPRP